MSEFTSRRVSVERPRGYRWHRGATILEVWRLAKTRRLSCRRISRRLAARGIAIGFKSVSRVLNDPARAERECRRLFLAGQLSAHGLARVLPWFRADSARSPKPRAARSPATPLPAPVVEPSIPAIVGAVMPGSGLRVSRSMTDDEFAAMLLRLSGGRSDERAGRSVLRPGARSL